MRSQIIQLSILILLSLTQSSVAVKRCYEVPRTTPPETTPSTTTTTTMPTTTLPPCGILMYYNVTASPNDPALYGFPSGTFFDNSIIYQGTGNFGGSCSDQNPGPARIMTSNGRKGPGAYYSCAGGEQFENKEAKFYLNHPNMKWVKTTGPAAAQVPGVIQVISPYETGYVGRIGVTIGNGTFQDIGKVFDSIFYYTGTNVNSYSSTQGAIEVLACQ